MHRRRFIRQSIAVGATLGMANCVALRHDKNAHGTEVQFTNAADIKQRGAAWKFGGDLVYVGSFATPTLTDSYVKPSKTAKLNFGKHTKFAYCPDNELLYTCGGDGQGQHWGGNYSGSMDTVGRYNVRSHTYAEDFRYRGYANEPTPRGLDFIAFTWAPSLKEFWLGPGFCANFTTQYPWLDFSWTSSNYASYNPVSRRFTDRGPRTRGAFGEGFAGSWDTKRDRLIWFDGFLKSLDPATNIVTASSVVGPPVSSHRIETADTWYDEVADELYFVQLATGRIYVCHVGKKTLRLIADLGVKADNSASYAVVYITDSRHCLIVYDESTGGSAPWKLVSLDSGNIQHLNLFAQGCSLHNTGIYHPPTRSVVLAGGSYERNMINGAAFHHYRSNL